MYTIKEYYAEIAVDEYLEKYVDIPVFLECCKRCSNYNMTWSCPSFDFDVESYWKKYSKLALYGHQILFTDHVINRNYTQEELNKLIESVVKKEKQVLTDKLFALEKKHPESISLSAGSCQTCGPFNCSRKENRPCRYPDQLRYSIESLGGNVGKTISDCFHIELEWIEDGKLPNYFVLVCGLLMN